MESDPLKINKEILSKRKDYFEKLMTSRYFFSLGSEIYRGVAGLYDWGPPGCAIRKNVQQLWREHFILEEDMQEISVTCLTPEKVFIASGHVKRFTDLIVKDKITGTGYRADKLIEEFIDTKITKESKKLTKQQIDDLLNLKQQADVMSKEELGKLFKQLNVRSPDTGNELSDPEPFNLMFATQIGPSTNQIAYLRPETAQGMFVNFNKLLNFVGGRIPFAAAQLGLGFRNEISPRAQLLRVREFDMAEIEHFFDPQDSTHPKYKYIKNMVLPLLTSLDQENTIKAASPRQLGECVDQKIICNQTMAYFIARTFLFLKAVGVNPENIRFRQHRKNEMAHYSCDCWDAEVELSYGWIECVGIANRSAYDLTAHSKESGCNLVASRRLAQPVTVNYVQIDLDKAKIGKEFKADQATLVKYLENMSEEEKVEFQKHFESNAEKVFNIEGKEYKFKKEMIKSIVNKTKQVQEEKYVPWVIEPAFGIGRIIYATLEHNFRMRDEKRTYLLLPPKIAPIKVSILSVIQNEQYDEIVQQIRTALIKTTVSSKVDESGGSIGRKYARTDELGIPFGITVDSQTLTDQTVTLREVSTTKQIRIGIQECIKTVFELSEGFLLWDDVLKKYPLFETQVEDDEK